MMFGRQDPKSVSQWYDLGSSTKRCFCWSAVIAPLCLMLLHTLILGQVLLLKYLGTKHQTGLFCEDLCKDAV